MSRSTFHNGGAYCRTERQLGNITAKTEQNGAWVSRESDHGIALSAKLVINYTATLAAGETMTLAATIQDAIDASGGGGDDFAEVAAFVIAVGDSGGSTEVGTAEVDIDLAGAREFIRSQPTVGTSASGTIAYSATIVFFGDARRPMTKSPVNLESADGI